MGGEKVDLNFPEGILEEMKTILQNADDAAILEAATAINFKGFTIAKKNVPVFRNKLAAMLTGSRLDPVVTGLIRQAGLNMRCVAVFSRKAIGHGLESFLGYFGKDRFLAALLVDDRPEIVELAKTYIRKYYDTPLPGRDEALLSLRDAFSPFVEEFAPIVAGAPAP